MGRRVGSDGNWAEKETRIVGGKQSFGYEQGSPYFPRCTRVDIQG